MVPQNTLAEWLRVRLGIMGRRSLRAFSGNSGRRRRADFTDSLSFLYDFFMSAHVPSR